MRLKTARWSALMGQSMAAGLVAVSVGWLVVTVPGAGAVSDDELIVFASDLSPAALVLGGRVNAAKLHSFALGGGARLDLSGDIGEGSDEQASLSPNGQLLAYIRESGSGEHSELWVSNADGTEARLLLASDAQEDFVFFGEDLAFNPPAWSPDGSRLAIDAVSTASCLPGYTKCAGWYTVVVDLDGRRVATLGGLNARWSPDGKNLLVLQGLFSLEDSHEWTLEVVRSDGTPVSTVSGNPGLCRAEWSWSPDGTRVAVEEAGCDGSGTSPRVRVALARGGAPRSILKGCCVSWAPDGSRLALRLRNASGWTVTTTDRDGKRAKPLYAATSGPLWAPVGNRIALVRRAQGRDELLSTLADGTNTKRLAVKSHMTIDGWSRDGTKLAVTSGHDLEVVPGNGGRTVKVHHDLDGAYNRVVGWNWNSTRLVVERWVGPTDRAHLWIVRPDGSGLRRLTAGTNDERGPAWSPDGHQIAFWRDEPSTRTHPEELAVYVISAYGGSPRRVVGGPVGSYASSPDFSPDGKRLTFTRWLDRDRQEIYVVDVNGAAPRRVTFTGGGSNNPAWSPDGRTIAFSRDAGAISVIGVDGKGARRVSTTPPGRSCVGPAWSPDGQQFATWCSDLGLVTLPVAGGTLRQLDENAIPTVQPAWSPDGQQLVYQSAGYGLTVVDAAGGRSVTIDLHGAAATDPDWAR